MPVGLCLWIPIAILSGDATQQGKLDVRAILWVLISALPLIPFLISTAFIDPRDWPRALGVVLGGLCVGAASAILFIFAFFLIVPAAVLGFILGLVKFFPCWRKDDAAGRALALLGLTPTAFYFFSQIAAEEFIHKKRDDSLLGMMMTAHQEQYIFALLLFIAHLLIGTWVILRIRSRVSAKPRHDSFDDLG